MGKQKYLIDKSWYGDIEKRSAFLNTHCKYTCKCSARTIIPDNMEKVICRNCGKWVFKNKRDEFKYRLNLTLNK